MQRRVAMEVVEDETPHAQHKLKDVAMKEVEDVHAQGDDEYDFQMEIFILKDTMYAIL